MSEDLYQKAILRLAGSAHGAGRLHGACCTGREANAMCGDVVTFDVRVDPAGRVTETANELKGCVLSGALYEIEQASAALLSEHAAGHSKNDIEALRAGVAAMLDGGPVPEGAWAAYEAFKPAAAYRSRHSCVLLPIDALTKALTDCSAS